VFLGILAIRSRGLFGSQLFGYELFLDPCLIGASIILSVAAIARAFAIKRYGRKGVENVWWARFAAWMAIVCGYLLLLAHFLLR